MSETNYPINGAAAEAALDALDGDDFDMDDEDDDDEFEAELRVSPPGPPKKAPPPPKKAPPKPAHRAPNQGPPRPLLAEVKRVQQDFAEIISGLSFGTDQHKIVVYRVEPTHDDITGRPMAGMLKTYYTAISEDLIQKEFGGGLYEARIMGPDPDTGRKGVLKKRETFRIAGEPRNLSGKREETPAPQQDNSQSRLMEQLLLSGEKEKDRLAREAAETRRLLMDSMTRKPDNSGESMLPLFMKMMQDSQAKQEESNRLLIKQMEDTRKLESERRAEERRLEEQKRKDDREEARQAREETERRYREDAAERQRQHEKEMLILERKAKEESQSADKSTHVMLEFMKMSREEEKSRAKEDKIRQDELNKIQFSVMQQASKQSTEMMMESTKFQMSMLTDALKEAKATKRGGMSETMQEMMIFADFQKKLKGGDEEEGGGSMADRVMDRLEGFVPSLAGVAAAYAGRPQAQPQLLGPRTMALVDQGPVYEPPVEQPTVVRVANAQKPAPQAAPAPAPAQPQAVPVVDEAPAPAPAVVQEQQEVENDFTEYQFPDATATQDTVVACLLKDIDLAIQNGANAEEISEEIVPHFAKTFPMVVFMLKKTKVDELIAFVNERVPEGWALRAPVGEKILREIHEIVNEA